MRDEEIEGLIEERDFFEGMGAAAWSVLANALGMQSGGLYATAIQAAERIRTLEAARRVTVTTSTDTKTTYAHWSV